MAKPHKNLDSIWLTAFNKRLISRNTADVTDLCSFLSFWGISSYRILFCTPYPPSNLSAYTRIYHSWLEIALQIHYAMSSAA